jgi:hypothetical protein
MGPIQEINWADHLNRAEVVMGGSLGLLLRRHE